MSISLQTATRQTGGNPDCSVCVACFQVKDPKLTWKEHVVKLDPVDRLHRKPEKRLQTLAKTRTEEGSQGGNHIQLMHSGFQYRE